MTGDRDTALRQAEQLLREGRLDAAIAEYVRLVAAEPTDWNAVNALGDLYVRAGDADNAAAQYTRVGDFLLAEGFLPKAAALYKKALKANPAHEHTLQQLGEIAVRRGRLGDARIYLRRLAEQRRGRGDQRGAAECLVRLGRLADADPDALIAAVRAAAEVGDGDAAAALLRSAAAALRHQRRRPESLAGYVEAARLCLTADTAGDDPDLLLTLARLEMGEVAGDPRPTLLRILAVAPGRRADVDALCHELAALGRREQAYECVEALVDVQLLEGDPDGAMAMLQRFLRHGAYVPALIRLAAVCADTGREAPLRVAQAALADAYLDTGYAAEARPLAEALLTADPTSAAHAGRLRRVLDAMAIADPDRVIARLRGASGDAEMPPAAAVELDLSDALTALVEPEPGPVPVPSLEAVFDALRAKAAQEGPAAAAALQFGRAAQLLRDGRTDDAIEALQAAAAAPAFRFAAAARLARLYVERGDLPQAVDWFERASAAPPPAPIEGLALLYDFAGALERLGEPARALAVLRQLDAAADAGGYRDVRARLALLAPAPGSPRA